MSGTLLCIAAVMLGVKFDVQPLSSGGVEYVILVDPLDLESLGKANELRSDLPPSAKDVRSFCIRLASQQPAAGGLSPSAFHPDGRTLFPAGGGPSLAPPPPQDRSTAARAATPPDGNSTAPGNKFPTAPAGKMPMPKVDTKPTAQWPVVPTKSEQGSGGAPSTPPLFTSLKPMDGPKAPWSLSLEPKGAKDATPPAGKPQTPKALSQTKEETPETAPPQESSGLYYSLAAGTAGSSSLMVFFGWVAWDYRRRYYSLLSQFMAVSDPFGSSEASESGPGREGPADSEDPPVSADD